LNEAFIAKLTWMVASNRASPCMDAIKSKYKVDKDWMHAEPRKYASTTWKAIERMKELVRKGACYLVGDGESIDVWKDPWVPWIPSFIPVPKQSISAPAPLKVASLFENNSRSWNLTRLLELFDVNTAVAIQKIVVPAIPTVDKLIWVLDSKGNFSVKAALKSSQPHLNADPEANWKALWKLKLHDRFKILVWRIASGVLPTKLNFAQKVGFGDTHCPFCLDVEESLEHLFFKCHISRAIWFGSVWALRSDLISLSTCKDFIKFVCEPPISTPASMVVNILNTSTSIQFALTLDCIWNLRNKVSYSDHKINILSTVKALDIRILEHLRALESVDASLDHNLTCWTTPLDDVIKLNVDAAIVSNRAAIAVVARNSKGIILNAWVKELMNLDSLVAKASAILWAMELAIVEGFGKVTIESDAKVCIDELSSSEASSNWKISTLIGQSLALVSRFSFCDFQWVRRDANQAAHALAKVVFSLRLPFCCNLDNLPPSLKEAWLRDLFFASS
jgi:ribonuclease HI